MDIIYHTPVVISMLCLAILIMRSAAVNVVAFFVGVSLLTLTILTLGQIIPLNNDHEHYLHYAELISLSGNFFDGPDNISPYANILAIGTLVLPESLAVAVTNAVAVIAIILCIMGKNASLFRHKYSLRLFLLVVTVFFLFPMSWPQIVSANKDFIVILGLITVVQEMLKFTSSDRDLFAPFHVRIKDALVSCFYMACGLLVVVKQRPYFFMFALVFGAVCVFFSILNASDRLKKLQLVIAPLLAGLMGSLVIALQMHELKKMEEAYVGRAVIDSIYGWYPSGMEENLAVVSVSIFEGLLGLVIKPFLPSAMSMGNILIGIWDQCLFAAFLFLYMTATSIPRRDRAIVLTCFLFHTIIQVFGSPNYGAFLRLRAVWVYFVVFCYVIHKFRQIHLEDDSALSVERPS